MRVQQPHDRYQNGWRSEDPLFLIKKPNTESVVWNYFGLQTDEDGRILPEKEDKPMHVQSVQEGCAR